jgi:hypothetical protein
VPRQITFNADRVGFDLDGEPVLDVSRDDAVAAPLSLLRDVTVTSLEHALAEYEERDGATVNYVFLSDVPTEEFDADLSPRHVGLDFIEDRLAAITGHGVHEEEAPLDVHGLLGPLLARHGAGPAGKPFLDDQGGHLSQIASFRLRGDDRTIGELYALAIEAQALIDAAGGTGRISASNARDLIRGGIGHLLLGQPENLWIDAKAEPHDLSNPAGKLEFAKDVAAFANTAEDAVIVYGFETTEQHGLDVIATQRAFELKRLDIGDAWQVLNGSLTPSIPDLDIGLVEASGGYGYGWIFIPARPAHGLPVLVSGALQGGKVKGSFISVPERSGERTVHWDASTIHGLIQAGRVALLKAAAEAPIGDAD